jgi:hypothetical protein
VKPGGRLRSCALGRNVARFIPQGSSQLRSRRIAGADEEDRPGREDRTRQEIVERPCDEMNIRRATIGARRSSLDEAGPLESPQVMCEEVRADVEPSRKLPGRPVGDRKVVDDRQPVGVGQGSEHRSPALTIPRIIDVRICLNGH